MIAKIIVVIANSCVVWWRPIMNSSIANPPRIDIKWRVFEEHFDREQTFLNRTAVGIAENRAMTRFNWSRGIETASDIGRNSWQPG